MAENPWASKHFDSVCTPEIDWEDCLLSKCDAEPKDCFVEGFNLGFGRAESRARELLAELPDSDQVRTLTQALEECDVPVERIQHLIEYKDITVTEAFQGDIDHCEKRIKKALQAAGDTEVTG